MAVLRRDLTVALAVEMGLAMLGEWGEDKLDALIAEARSFQESLRRDPAD